MDAIAAGDRRLLGFLNREMLEALPDSFLAYLSRISPFLRERIVGDVRAEGRSMEELHRLIKSGAFADGAHLNIRPDLLERLKHENPALVREMETATREHDSEEALKKRLRVFYRGRTDAETQDKARTHGESGDSIFDYRRLRWLMTLLPEGVAKTFGSLTFYFKAAAAPQVTPVAAVPAHELFTLQMVASAKNGSLNPDTIEDLFKEEDERKKIDRGVLRKGVEGAVDTLIMEKNDLWKLAALQCVAHRHDRDLARTLSAKFKEAGMMVYGFEESPDSSAAPLAIVFRKATATPQVFVNGQHCQSEREAGPAKIKLTSVLNQVARGINPHTSEHDSRINETMRMMALNAIHTLTDEPAPAVV